MTKPIVDFQMLETAEDLFRELSPATGKLWRVNDHLSPARGDWFFRGQANDVKTGLSWNLHPSARRVDDPFLPYLAAQGVPRQLRARV